MYTDDPHYNEERIRQVSLAAAVLANWVMSIANYHKAKLANTPEGKFNQLIQEKCELKVQQEIEE